MDTLRADYIAPPPTMSRGIVHRALAGNASPHPTAPAQAARKLAA